MRVAVVGLGVMGGSLARALGRVSPNGEGSTAVVGWAADASDRAAATAAGVRIGDGVAGSVRDADVVVLATPLSTLPGLASTVADAAPGHTIIMDVASLQAPALEAARGASLTDRWVSAHPMVGSERSGFEASRVDLYASATVFLSADEAVSPETRHAATRFWARLDASSEWTVPGDHDDRMATASHLPQMVSTALADTMAASGLEVDALGPGGRDTTRLAASSVAMWGDLFEHARPALIRGLRGLASRLEEDAAALERGETDVPVQRLTRAGEWRRDR